MDNLRFVGYLFGQPVIVDDEVSFEQRMGTMALDMVGQITGMDLFLVERQGRKAVEKTAQNYEAVIDKWEAHANDLKRQLALEKCHSAGVVAQYNLLRKFVKEGRPEAATFLTNRLGKDGKPLAHGHAAYWDAYEAKAKELNLQL